MKAIRAFVLAVLLVFLSASLLMAQTYQGRILGLVTDQSGAVVGGAKVTITNTATGISRTLATTAAGEYNAPNLEPGPYMVTAEAPGFKKVERTALRLEVAKDIRVDFTLSPGAISEVVTVSEEAPVVNTTNDVLGGTFSNKAINELPLLGRDFQNLADLQPGIQRTPGGGFLSTTANGNRPEDNNYIVDGLDDNDAYYGTTVINAEGVEGTPATHLPIDAIQEFNIQSSPESDYGWKPGAIINIGIKSGTNSFHGSTYYFNRNSALDARNWFNPGPSTVAALNFHQFGASAGGPLFKNKLFIFGNYEAVRDKVGNPLQVLAPVSVSIGDADNSIVDAFAACQEAGNCSSVSQQLATLLPFNPGPDTTLNMDLNNRNREDNGILKLDYHFSEKHTFVGTYFIGDSTQTEEDSTVLNPLFLSQSQTRAQVVGGGWIWAPTPRLTNQFRIGYNRFWQQVYQADHNTNPTAYGLNTGVLDPNNFGMPEIRITGFTQHTLGGNQSWPLYTTPNQTLQFTDDANYVRGKHNFHFGGEFRWGNTDNLRNTFGSGEIRFSDLESFTTGDVRSRGGNFVFVGDSHRIVSQRSFGAFLQDSWRVGPTLTIDAGMRYDVSFPIHEQHDLLSNFDPSVGLIQVGRGIDEPYHTDFNNFAPRLGIAWDPRGKGRTVFRVGAGIIYEIPHISVFIGQNNTNANGISLNPTGVAGAPVGPGGGNIAANTLSPPPSQMSIAWKNGDPVFGDLSPSDLSCDTDNLCPVFGVDPNLKTPYIFNWNANVQQAMWKNAALTIAYVGNKGTKLYNIRDINQNIYANDSEGDEQSGRPFNAQFPSLSYIYSLANGADSIYHGLQVTLRQNSTKGVYFVAGYTWAHAIDTSGSNRQFNIQNSYDPAAERSNADSDIRHRFTFAMTYAPPSKPGYAQMLQGWNLNGIFTAQTGTPIFFYDSSNDISGTGEFNDHWNITGSPANLHWSKNIPIPYIDPSQFNTIEYDPDNELFHAVSGANPTAQRCFDQAFAMGGQAGADQLIGGPDEGTITGGCYVSGGTVVTPPAPGTFGNMRRNVVYGPGFVNLDFSVSKAFKFGERFSLQLRGEFFNILNHPNFADPDHDLSDGASLGLAQYTPDIAASNPVIGSGGSRHIQIGAKIIW
ncbi:MAG TPA: TonB-dependent receptor [Terriglobales bacterium]|nr:TonB-dependent receptor [Terriglobales bacterium]